jgi:hypothetical protein
MEIRERFRNAGAAVIGAEKVALLEGFIDGLESTEDAGAMGVLASKD